MRLYFSVPFAGLVAFFAVYLVRGRSNRWGGCRELTLQLDQCAPGGRLPRPTPCSACPPAWPPAPQGIVNNPRWSYFVRFSAMQVAACPTYWPAGAAVHVLSRPGSAPCPAPASCTACAACFSNACASAHAAHTPHTPHTAQAVLLDVILILPGLVESILRPGGMGGLGLQVPLLPPLQPAAAHLLIHLTQAC